MPIVSLDGRTWHYALNPGPEGVPPLVLLHGASANLRIWDPVVPALEHDFDVYRPDLLGHGLSAKPEEPAAYDVASWAEGVRQLFDHWGLSEAVLVGHSLGGMIALEFVLQWPERVRGLGLLDTTPGRLFREPEHLAQEEALIAFIHSVGMADAFDQFQRLNPYAAQWGQLPGGMPRLKEEFLYNSVESYVATRYALRSKPRHTDRLAEIHVPTAVFVGEHDEAFLAAADVLERKLPRATKYVIPDAGHSPQLDNPEATARILAQGLCALLDGNSRTPNTA